MLSLTSCGDSNSGGAGNRAVAVKISEGPLWDPHPIEIPQPKQMEWTPDDMLKAVEGPVWTGTGERVACMKFDFAGEAAVVALTDGSCHVIDPKTGDSRQHWKMDESSELVAMEITVDGKHVVTFHDGGQCLRVRQLADGAMVRDLEHSQSPISAFALATDPQLLAVGDEAGSVKVWNLATGQTLAEGVVDNAHGHVSAIAFANDCHEMYVADGDARKIGVYGLPGLNSIASIEHTSSSPVRIVPAWNGNCLMALCSDRVVEFIVTQTTGAANVAPYQRVGGAVVRRGSVKNCFLLQDSNQVCCYLGGDAFDYYGLPSGGIAGSNGEEMESSVQVAMTADGKLAATAFADGKVRFYEMPGPGKSLAVRNREASQKARELLVQRNFDAIDKFANEALADNQLDRSRWSSAMVFVFTLRRPAEDTDAAWEAHLAVLQEWLDTKPESRAAKIMLAEATSNYAWYLRGSRSAAETSPASFRAFHEQLAKTDELLTKLADPDIPSAALCATQIRVGMGLGTPQDEILEAWSTGLRDSPQFVFLHTQAVSALLPKWGGQRGSVAKLADRARATLRPADGLLCYGLIAEAFLAEENPESLVAEGFDLAVMEQAAQLMLREYPESTHGNNCAAIIAVLRADHAAAASRFRLLVGTANEAMWKHRSIYDKFRAWSQEIHTAGEQDSGFLGSWKGLRQVAFSETGASLRTLAMDFQQEIKDYDSATLHLDQVQAIPFGISPLFMSRTGRLIVCADYSPQQRVALFAPASSSVVPLSNVTAQHAIAFSDNEEQLVVYDHKSLLRIYDCSKIGDEAPRTITLDREIDNVAFPDSESAWSIIVVEPGGRFRQLAEDGKDIISPLQFAIPISHVQALVRSSRVIVVGESLFETVDLKTGKSTNLIPTPQAKTEFVAMSALTVSHDGRIVAIARRNALSAGAEAPYPIEIWELDRGSRRHVYAGHDAVVQTLSFAADDGKLASGDALGFVRVWTLPKVRD